MVDETPADGGDSKGTDMTPIPRVICGSPDHPLLINGITITCYVLDDDRRVIVQRGLAEALDMSQGTAGKGGADRLASFLAGVKLNPFVPHELILLIKNPIKFRCNNGSIAYGYDASVIPAICRAVVNASDSGELMKQQDHIVARCRILLDGLSTVGIIALVDEATGYQKARATRALAEILEKFIAKAFAPWTKSFPDEYYEQIYRLNKWTMSANDASTKRPGVIGLWTNDFVYSRLAPGVLQELQKMNPAASGQRRRKHHQWLTPEMGHPKLREHLAGVVAIMKLSNNWDDFKLNMKKVFPRHNETMLLFQDLRFEDPA